MNESYNVSKHFNEYIQSAMMRTKFKGLFCSESGWISWNHHLNPFYTSSPRSCFPERRYARTLSH